MNNDSYKNKMDVVIPVYNGKKFILQALDSVVHQTLPPTRIIVVDDGSTDKTHELVTEYAKTSPVEIKIIKKENGGLSSARNTGIKASSADFVAFLDADDVWTENKLEKQMEVFERTEFKNLALVYCNYDVIDEASNVMYQNYKAPLDHKRMRGMVFGKLLERNQIAGSGSGVLVKREIFDTVGFFDEKLKWGEDWDMWLRIAEKYEVDFTPETLVHIRKHGGNMTSTPVKTFENELYFYSKWISVLNGRYAPPLFWSDKITFRILSQLPKMDFLKILNEKLPGSSYRQLFRLSLGSFWLYLPIFFIRQVFNLVFYPNYLSILTGLFKNKGR